MNAGEIPTVTIVDDDESVRRSLGRLLVTSGYRVRAFASAAEFLREPPPIATAPGCLLVDVRMPDIDGLELYAILCADGREAPIVFMTGHGDVQIGVRAMKWGAIDFLLKPFTDDELLDAIQRAVARDAERRAESAALAALRNRIARLTPREWEVCAQVVEGRLNKQIAAELGIREKTVKVHRSRVMAKLQAASVAELVRMVTRLRDTPVAAPRPTLPTVLGPRRPDGRWM